MNEILTIDEIYRRYPDEWVLLGEVQTGPKLELLSGAVLCHSKDHDEVDQQLLKLRPTRFAVRYTGRAPANMEFVL